MNKIIFPLKTGMTGQAVLDLQEALIFLLEKTVVIVKNAKERKKHSDALKLEFAKHTYGPATEELVKLFQKEHNLGPNGNVDATTAERLNGILAELETQEPDTSESKSHIVKGDVRFTNGTPAVGLKVQAIHDTESSGSVVRGGCNKRCRTLQH